MLKGWAEWVSMYVEKVVRKGSPLFSKVGNDQPWLMWLRGLSAGLRTEGSPVQFPLRAHAGVWSGSPAGGMQEATDPCISHTWMLLCLSFPLPFPLSKNKYIQP